MDGEPSQQSETPEELLAQIQAQTGGIQPPPNAAAPAPLAEPPAPPVAAPTPSPAPAQPDEAKALYDQILANTKGVEKVEPKKEDSEKPKTYIEQILETGYKNLTPEMNQILSEETNPENLKEINEKMPAFTLSDSQAEILFKRNREKSWDDLKKVPSEFWNSIGPTLQSVVGDFKKYGGAAFDYIKRAYENTDYEGYDLTLEQIKKSKEAEQGLKKAAAAPVLAAVETGGDIARSLGLAAALGTSLTDRLDEAFQIKTEEESLQNFKDRLRVKSAFAKTDVESPTVLEKVFTSPALEEIAAGVIKKMSPSVDELMAEDVDGKQFGGDRNKALVFKERQAYNEAANILRDLKDESAELYDPEMVSAAGWFAPFGNHFSAIAGGLGAISNGARALAKIKGGKLTAAEANALAEAQLAERNMAAFKSAAKKSEVGLVGKIADRAAKFIEDTGNALKQQIDRLPESLKPYVEKALPVAALTGVTSAVAYSDADSLPKLGALAAALAGPRMISDLAKGKAAAGGGVRGMFSATASLPETAATTRLLLKGINPKLADYLTAKGEQFISEGVHATTIATALGLVKDESPEQIARGAAEAVLMGQAYKLVHGGLSAPIKALDGRGLVGRDVTPDYIERLRNQKMKTLRAMSPESRTNAEELSSWKLVIDQAESQLNSVREELATLEAETARFEGGNEQMTALERQDRIAELRRRATQLEGRVETYKRTDAETRQAYSDEVFNVITNADALVNGALTPQKNVRIEVLSEQQILDALRAANPNQPLDVLESWANNRGLSIRETGQQNVGGVPVGPKPSAGTPVFDPFKQTLIINSDKIRERVVGRQTEDGRITYSAADDSIADVLGHEIGHALERTSEYQKATEPLRKELFGDEIKGPNGEVIYAEGGIYSPEDLLAQLNNKYLRGKTPEEKASMLKGMGLLDNNGNLLTDKAIAYMQSEMIADMNGLSMSGVALRSADPMNSLLDWVQTKTKNRLVNNAIEAIRGDTAISAKVGQAVGVQFSPEQLKRNQLVLRTLADLDGWLTMTQDKPQRTLTKAEVMANRALFNHYYKDSGAVRTTMIAEVVDASGNVVERVLLPDSAKTGEWASEDGQVVKKAGFGELPSEVGGRVPQGGKVIVRSDIVVDEKGRPVEARNVKEMLLQRSQLIRAALENAPDAQSPDAMRARSKDGLMFRGKLTPAQRKNIENLPELIVPYSIKLKLFALNDAMARNDGTRMLAEYAARLSDSGKYVDFSPRIIDFVPIGFQFSKAGNFLTTTVSIDGLSRKIDLMLKQMPSRFSLWDYDKSKIMRDLVDIYLPNHAKGVEGDFGLHPDPQVALQKKNILNDIFNAFDVNTEDSNPDRTELQKTGLTAEEKKEWKRSDPNTVIRSRRLDSLTDMVESNQEKFPIDYGKLKVNFLPEQQDATERPETLRVEDERITDAAYIRPDGKIMLGASHLEANPDASKDPEERLSNRYGFMTNTGRVVSREEAYDIAKEAGQIIKDEPSQVLRSENVDLKAERNGPDVSFLPDGESPVPTPQEREDIRRAAPLYSVQTKRDATKTGRSNEIVIQDENGNDVARASYRVSNDDPTRAEVRSTVVYPQYRNKGYGQVLYAELGNAAAADGASVLYSDAISPAALRRRQAMFDTEVTGELEYGGKKAYEAESYIGKPPREVAKIIGDGVVATGATMHFLPIDVEHFSPNKFERPDVKGRGGKTFGNVYGYGLYVSDSRRITDLYRDRFRKSIDVETEDSEYNPTAEVYSTLGSYDDAIARGLQPADAEELASTLKTKGGYTYQFRIPNPEKFAEDVLNVYAQPKELQKGLKQIVNLLMSEQVATNKKAIVRSLEEIVQQIKDNPQLVDADKRDEAEYIARKAHKMDEYDTADQLIQVLGFDGIKKVAPKLSDELFDANEDSFLKENTALDIYRTGAAYRPEMVDALRSAIKRNVFDAEKASSVKDLLAREPAMESGSELMSSLFPIFGIEGIKYSAPELSQSRSSAQFRVAGSNAPAEPRPPQKPIYNYVAFKPESLDVLSREGDVDIETALSAKGYVKGINFLPDPTAEGKRFSRMERTLTDKVPRRARPEQITKTLENSGVSRDEMRWRDLSGAMDELKDAEGYVSRDALLENLQTVRRFDLENARAKSYIHYILPEMAVGRYTGERNYREIIIKLPDIFQGKNILDKVGLDLFTFTKDYNDNDYKAAFDKLSPFEKLTMFRAFGFSDSAIYESKKNQEILFKKIISSQKERQYGFTSAIREFESSHYENMGGGYLAHVRLTEGDIPFIENGRLSPKKTTIIEESQSDRLQLQSSSGYRSGAVKGLVVVESEDDYSGDIYYSIQTKSGRPFLKTKKVGSGDEAPLTFKTKEEADYVLNRVQNSLDSTGDITDLMRSMGYGVVFSDASIVGDAPFKNTWALQTFKVAIDEAIRNETPYIAFPTADEFIRRAGTTRISWQKDGDFYEIVADDSGGTVNPLGVYEFSKSERTLSQLKTGKVYSEKSLQNFLRGYDDSLAKIGDNTSQFGAIEKTLWEKMQQSDSGSYEPRAEGFKKFYNEIFVKEINKYIKQYGAQLEKAQTANSFLTIIKNVSEMNEDEMSYLERSGRLWKSKLKNKLEETKNLKDLKFRISTYIVRNDQVEEAIAKEKLNGNSVEVSPVEFWRVKLPDQLVEDAVNFGQVAFLPERPVVAIPERFLDIQGDPEARAAWEARWQRQNKGASLEGARRPEQVKKAFFDKYIVRNPVQIGGIVVDGETGENLTNQIFAKTHISVDGNKIAQTVSDGEVPDTLLAGRKVQANLYKKNKGWSWVSENPPELNTIVSVSRGKEHFYALNSIFENGVKLQTYPDRPSEPRIRPTGFGELEFSNEVVGRIRTPSGEEHPVYRKIRVVAPPEADKASGIQFLPSDTTGISKQDTEDYSVVVGAKAGQYGWSLARASIDEQNPQLQVYRRLRELGEKSEDVREKVMEPSKQMAAKYLKEPSVLEQRKAELAVFDKEIQDTIASRNLQLINDINKLNDDLANQRISDYEAEQAKAKIEDEKALMQSTLNTLAEYKAFFADVGNRAEFDYEAYHLPPPLSMPASKEITKEGYKELANELGKILNSPEFKALSSDFFGSDIASKMQVVETVGTWEGNREASFVIKFPATANLRTPEMDEAFRKFATSLGVGLVQDATIVYRPRKDSAETPAKDNELTQYFVYQDVAMDDKKQKKFLSQVEKMKLDGSPMDWTLLSDRRGIKMMYWGSNTQGFEDKLSEMAALLGPNAKVETAAVDSQLYETQSETKVGRIPKATDTLSETTGGQSLLERSLDTVLKPYAKAAVRVGYTFNPKEFAQRFGIPIELALDVESAIFPNSYKNVSIRKLFENPRKLAGSDAFISDKKYDAKVSDLIGLLESRTNREGVISPTDFSENAKTFIARVIADEVEGQVERAQNNVGNAVLALGWYGAAVDKTKGILANSPITNKLEWFDRSSPKYDPEKEFVLNALIGITSQGNNVFENMKMGLRTGLMYLAGIPLEDVVKKLGGTFGDKTKAIESNILKLSSLIKTVGIKDLIKTLGEHKTVSEWKKIVNKDERFHFAKDESSDKKEPVEFKGLAEQDVTGYSMFGPKIGSFINNLRGDFSTLTADLWFTRTWNRILGKAFDYDPKLAAEQYKSFKNLLTETFKNDPNNKDLPDSVRGKTEQELEAFTSSPDEVKKFAAELFKVFRDGQYKEKSELRRAAKVLTENFEMVTAAPRNDRERKFQEDTIKLALKMLRRKGLNLTVADVQASLWFNEKELFQIYGAARAGAKQADYADGADFALQTMNGGRLFEVKRKVDKKVQELRILSPEEEKRITGVEPDPNQKKLTVTEYMKNKKIDEPDPDVDALTEPKEEK